MVKKVLKWLWNRLRNVLPPVLFFVVTFGIFMPCSLFIGNSTEFVIGFKEVYPLIVCTVIIGFAVLMILGFLLVPDVVFRVYSALVYGVTLGLYIQGNFMNPHFGVLNGSDIDWSQYKVYSIVGIIVWALCLIVPMVLIFAKKKIGSALIKWSSYAFVVMQVVALVSVLMSASEAETKKGDYSNVLLKKDLYEYSSDENIIVFLVDTLDKDYYEEIVEPAPEYQEYLKNFTYYDNCITGASPTVTAIPMLLTGEMYTDLSQEFSDYQIEAYEKNTLFRDMQANNYKVNLFTETTLANGIAENEVDNMKGCDQFAITDKKGFTECLYKFASFYAMPVALKQHFWFYSEEFNQYVGLTNEEYEAYQFDDPQLYKDYKSQGITLTDDRNVFTFYHMKGSHNPYDADEHLNAVASGSSTLEKQTKGCFNFIFECMDEMKEKGIYDNSTIIITADHGQKDVYQSGAVMVKRKGEHKEYSTNSAPVMFDNLRATIASEFLSDYSAYGEALEDVPDEPRERLQTVHMIGQDVFPDNPEVADHAFARFAFTGDSKDMSKMTVIPWADHRKQK